MNKKQVLFELRDYAHLLKHSDLITILSINIDHVVKTRNCITLYAGDQQKWITIYSNGYFYISMMLQSEINVNKK